MRDPNAFATGVFAGVSKLTESYSDYDPGLLGTFGVEGHLYLGAFTIAGQVASSRASSSAPCSVRAELSTWKRSHSASRLLRLPGNSSFAIRRVSMISGQ